LLLTTNYKVYKREEKFGKTLFASKVTKPPKINNTKIDNCVVHLQDEGIVGCGLARHFKTDPTETVDLCFGYAKTPC
jgi:hypothetical protein